MPKDLTVILILEVKFGDDPLKACWAGYIDFWCCAENAFKSPIEEVLSGTQYSRMNQVKFVEDSL